MGYMPIPYKKVIIAFGLVYIFCVIVYLILLLPWLIPYIISHPPSFYEYAAIAFLITPLARVLIKAYKFIIYHIIPFITYHVIPFINLHIIPTLANVRVWVSANIKEKRLIEASIIIAVLLLATGVIFGNNSNIEVNIVIEGFVVLFGVAVILIDYWDIS